ncbi:MAG: glycosyltransferase family 9 protein [bacterium]
MKAWLRLRHEDRVVHINRILDDAESIMVCFPDGFEEGMGACKVLPYIRERFPQGKITVFVTRINLEKVRKSPDIDNFISLSDKDFNHLCLPTRDLINRVKWMEFDVAIDLNRQFHLPTAYLCYRSGAKLRIGLRDRDSAPFFNFEIIAMDDERAKKEPLVSIIRVLQTV